MKFVFQIVLSQFVLYKIARMCMKAYLSQYMCPFFSLDVPIIPFISFCPSICQLVQSIDPFLLPAIYPSIYRCIRPTTHASTHPSPSPCHPPSIHQSMHPCIHLCRHHIYEPCSEKNVFNVSARYISKQPV